MHCIKFYFNYRINCCSCSCCISKNDLQLATINSVISCGTISSQCSIAIAARNHLIFNKTIIISYYIMLLHFITLQEIHNSSSTLIDLM